MTKVIIQAANCKFETRGGVTMFTTLIDFKPPIARKVVEIKTCADIDREMAALSARVGVEYPDSYYVSVILPDGQRAPAGFRQRRFKIEVDRDTARAVAAA